MNNIELKKVTHDDISALQTISRQTFIETFANQNNPEDLQIYLNDNFSLVKLEKELKNSNSAFYFAIKDNNIVAYLKTNRDIAQTEIKEKTWLEIERIYVLKAFQRKKTGQFLLEYTIRTAKEKNMDYIWLGVWEKNLNAISFYCKNGFVEFDKHIFKLGNDLQTDILMKLKL